MKTEKDTQFEELKSKMVQLEELKSKVTRLEEAVQKQELNQNQVADSGMPSSCADLRVIGHALSGLYSVMGATQVESVYCDFTKLPTDSGKCTWLNNYAILLRIICRNLQQPFEYRRFPDVDRSSRREIIARLLLCPKEH